MSEEKQKTADELFEELNELEQEVVTVYLSNGLNQTRAYMQVKPEMEYDTAKVLASRLLTRDHVRAFLRARMAEMSMGAQEVLLRLAQQAGANLEPFLKDGGPLGMRLDLKSPEAKAHLHLIKKVKQRDRVIQGEDDETIIQRELEIEVVDSQGALKELAKILQLSKDGLTLNVNSGGGGVTIYVPDNGREKKVGDGG